MQKIILILITTCILFGYDISNRKDPKECVSYRVQYEKYIEKADKNKKMSSRYIVIAAKYKSMFDACKKDFYSPKGMMREASGVTIDPNKYQQANSYRVNPYNN